MLKKQEVKLYFGSVLLIELLGALGAFVIRDGIAEYGMEIQPVISPPAVLFLIVWTILYALMGIGLACIFSSEESMAKTIGLNLFWIQLFFNLMCGGLKCVGVVDEKNSCYLDTRDRKSVV